MLHPALLVFVKCSFFFFNDTATTEIYTLSLHDALPISRIGVCTFQGGVNAAGMQYAYAGMAQAYCMPRSEEHTSELQSRQYLVCRLLLEKKKKSFALTEDEQYPAVRRQHRTDAERACMQ